MRTKTRRKYTIVIANQVEIETKTPDPIQSPSLVEKTPESIDNALKGHQTLILLWYVL